MANKLFMARGSLFSMDHLPDDLLLEIFVRLSCKSLLRCKSISKRWFSLISNPNLLCRFIYRHHTLFLHHHNEEYPSLRFHHTTMNELMIMFPSKVLSVLEFPTPFFEVYLGHLQFVGCCSGLVAFCNRLKPSLVYYVCNPITDDWIQLPPPPSHANAMEGFICEPYYSVEADTVTLSSHHRFRVVRIIGPLRKIIQKLKFYMEVFSSETGQWDKLIVDFVIWFTWHPGFVGVGHKGRLHFMNADCVLVYDPFNNVKQYSTIHYPSNFNIKNSHIGTSCGNLRISDVRGHAVRVWELRDSSCWHLLHEITLMYSDIKVVAFHPSKGNMVYIERKNQYGYCIYLCNFTGNKFERAAKRISHAEVLPLELPIWPTPIPSLGH